MGVYTNPEEFIKLKKGLSCLTKQIKQKKKKRLNCDLKPETT